MYYARGIYEAVDHCYWLKLGCFEPLKVTRASSHIFIPAVTFLNATCVGADDLMGSARKFSLPVLSVAITHTEGLPACALSHVMLKGAVVSVPMKTLPAAVLA